MNQRRKTAYITLAALLMSSICAGAALAHGNDHGLGLNLGLDADHGKPRISEQFKDMADFTWGLNFVTKMQVKGIFQGRGEGIFAPGAKITHQEAAVALVRLMDKEAEAKAMTAADVEVALKEMSDHGQIADWAKASFATLVKLGVVSAKEKCAPVSDATRLDIAVMLVKGMGLEAEAKGQMNATLAFKDAAQIPPELVGYVAVAVDHKLITGYDDRTFRPEQAVKRVELAVMMGRADGILDRHKQDEEANTPAPEERVITGSITAQATPTTNGKVSPGVPANNTTPETEYKLEASAQVKLNGQAALLSVLHLGDIVKATNPCKCPG